MRICLSPTWVAVVLLLVAVPALAQLSDAEVRERMGRLNQKAADQADETSDEVPKTLRVTQWRPRPTASDELAKWLQDWRARNDWRGRELRQQIRVLQDQPTGGMTPVERADYRKRYAELIRQHQEAMNDRATAPFPPPFDPHNGFGVIGESGIFHFNPKGFHRITVAGDEYLIRRTRFINQTENWVIGPPRLHRDPETGIAERLRTLTVLPMEKLCYRTVVEVPNPEHPDAAPEDSPAARARTELADDDHVLDVGTRQLRDGLTGVNILVTAETPFERAQAVGQRAAEALRRNAAARDDTLTLSIVSDAFPGPDILTRGTHTAGDDGVHWR